MPAEPVSKASGIETATEPTAVTITVRRAGFSVDPFGKRSTVVGLSMVVIGGLSEPSGTPAGAAASSEQKRNEGEAERG